MSRKTNKKQERQQKQQPILGYLIVFIIGFICGIGFAAYKIDSGKPAVNQHIASGQGSEAASAIHSLEAEVTANPENFQAWVQLGHLYYDTNQYPKAIAAYTTSLKYHPGDANLLTDLGVMCRRTGDPEKAIEWFAKAQAMDANHQPSRLNEGIVRHFDLGDTKGAIVAWNELLAINPEMRLNNGEKLSEFIARIETEQKATSQN